MGSMKYHSFALLVLAIFSSAAHADILFVDLNGSDTEIRAATAAAKARGERLVVVPPVELRQYAHDHIPSAVPELAAAAVAELEQQGRPLTSVVVSGHSNGKMFFGWSGTIELSDFHQLAEAHPFMRESLRSVLLWSCYSGTIGNFAVWKKEFPQLAVVFGYSDAAPKAKTAASPALLKEALIGEDHIDDALNLKAARRAVKELSLAQRTYLSALIGECYVGVKTGSLRLDDMLRACPRELARLRDMYTGVQDYFLPEQNSAHVDPPANPHSSELRAFYSYYQTAAACVGEDSGIPSRESTLALLFFRTVRRNFAHFYAEDLERVRSELAGVGVTIPSLDGDTTRQQTLHVHELLVNASLLSSLDDAARTRTHALAQKIDSLLIKLECVPGQWITEEPLSSEKPVAPRLGCNEN